MNCKEVHNKLLFFIEHDLSNHEHQLIENHLASCGKCKLLYQQMNNDLAIINNEKNIETNSFFYTRLAAKMKESNKKSSVIGQLILNKAYIQNFTYTMLVAFSLLIGIYLGTSPLSDINASELNSQNTDYQLFADDYSKIDASAVNFSEFNIDEADFSK